MHRITTTELQSLLSAEWREVLEHTFKEQYWSNIAAVLSTQQYLPKKEEIFNAINNCPPNKVKAVIIGQDPYIHSSEAHGYSFSVQPSVTRLPPSLKTILEEVRDDYGMQTIPKNGCLLPWVSEGVLLLNSILTVSPGTSFSHKNIGWEYITSEIIRFLDNNYKLVFLAFGAQAQRVCNENISNNPVIKTGHPSPLNSKIKFSGSRCFNKANDELMKMNILPIRWTKLWN